MGLTMGACVLGLVMLTLSLATADQVCPAARDDARATGARIMGCTVCRMTLERWIPLKEKDSNLVARQVNEKVLNDFGREAGAEIGEEPDFFLSLSTKIGDYLNGHFDLDSALQSCPRLLTEQKCMQELCSDTKLGCCDVSSGRFESNRVFRDLSADDRVASRQPNGWAPKQVRVKSNKAPEVLIKLGYGTTRSEEKVIDIDNPIFVSTIKSLVRSYLPYAEGALGLGFKIESISFEDIRLALRSKRTKNSIVNHVGRKVSHLIVILENTKLTAKIPGLGVHDVTLTIKIELGFRIEGEGDQEKVVLHAREIRIGGKTVKGQSEPNDGWIVGAAKRALKFAKAEARALTAPADFVLREIFHVIKRRIVNSQIEYYLDSDDLNVDLGGSKLDMHLSFAEIASDGLSIGLKGSLEDPPLRVSGVNLAPQLLNLEKDLQVGITFDYLNNIFAALTRKGMHRDVYLSDVSPIGSTLVDVAVRTTVTNVLLKPLSSQAGGASNINARVSLQLQLLVEGEEIEKSTLDVDVAPKIVYDETTSSLRVLLNDAGDNAPDSNLSSNGAESNHDEFKDYDSRAFRTNEAVRANKANALARKLLRKSSLAKSTLALATFAKQQLKTLYSDLLRKLHVKSSLSSGPLAGAWRMVAGFCDRSAGDDDSTHDDSAADSSSSPLGDDSEPGGGPKLEPFLPSEIRSKVRAQFCGGKSALDLAMDRIVSSGMLGDILSQFEAFELPSWIADFEPELKVNPGYIVVGIAFPDYLPEWAVAEESTAIKIARVLIPKWYSVLSGDSDLQKIQKLADSVKKDSSQLHDIVDGLSMHLKGDS